MVSRVMGEGSRPMVSRVMGEGSRPMVSRVMGGNPGLSVMSRGKPVTLPPCPTYNAPYLSYHP